MKISRRGFIGAVAAAVVAPKILPAVEPAPFTTFSLASPGGALTEEMLIATIEQLRNAPSRHPVFYMNTAQRDAYLELVAA